MDVKIVYLCHVPGYSIIQPLNSKTFSNLDQGLSEQKIQPGCLRPHEPHISSDLSADCHRTIGDLLRRDDHDISRFRHPADVGCETWKSGRFLGSFQILNSGTLDHAQCRQPETVRLTKGPVYHNLGGADSRAPDECEADDFEQWQTGARVSRTFFIVFLF
jgi:hypothetical protein